MGRLIVVLARAAQFIHDTAGEKSEEGHVKNNIDWDMLFANWKLIINSTQLGSPKLPMLFIIQYVPPLSSGSRYEMVSCYTTPFMPFCFSWCLHTGCPKKNDSLTLSHNFWMTLHPCFTLWNWIIYAQVMAQGCLSIWDTLYTLTLCHIHHVTTVNWLWHTI